MLLLPFQQISPERSQGLILSVYSLIDIYISIYIFQFHARQAISSLSFFVGGVEG